MHFVRCCTERDVLVNQRRWASLRRYACSCQDRSDEVADEFPWKIDMPETHSLEVKDELVIIQSYGIDMYKHTLLGQKGGHSQNLQVHYVLVLAKDFVINYQIHQINLEHFRRQVLTYKENPKYLRMKMITYKNQSPPESIRCCLASTSRSRRIVVLGVVYFVMHSTQKRLFSFTDPPQCWHFKDVFWNYIHIWQLLLISKENYRIQT